MIDDARDGSTWSEVHSELNPPYRQITQTLGVADLYLIDAITGAIVYSTAKRPDFATNLKTGPNSGSTLAALVSRVLRSPETGRVGISDFARYNPAIAAPMAFFAAPIIDDGRTVGVLAIRLSTDSVNEIMTNGNDWGALGLGRTGEVYAVGPDGRFRSDARPYLEDPTTYVDDAIATGTLDPASVPGVEASGTTVLFQRMGQATLDAADDAAGAIIESTNYLGEPVFTTVSRLPFEQLEWRVVVQVGRSEVTTLTSGAQKAASVTIVMFILVLTFGAVVWASRFVWPLRALAARLRRHTTAEPASTQTDADEVPATTREFSTLTDGIETMLSGLSRRQRELDEAAEVHRTLIRRLLPEDISRRLEAGESHLVERIPKATVAAVIVEGLGDLVGTESSSQIHEDLQTVVAMFDEIARRHGLERIKIVGDTYLAACGLGRPYLDHAPRALRFAGDVIGTLDGGADGVESLPAAIGLASGPLVAGLTGSNRLVYDAWGPTVTTAESLARAATPGTIVVDAAVVEQLPPDIVLAERPGLAPGSTAWIVGEIPAAEVTP